MSNTDADMLTPFVLLTPKDRYDYVLQIKPHMSRLGKFLCNEAPVVSVRSWLCMEFVVLRMKTLKPSVKLPTLTRCVLCLFEVSQRLNNKHLIDKG